MPEEYNQIVFLLLLFLSIIFLSVFVLFSNPKEGFNIALPTNVNFNGVNIQNWKVTSDGRLIDPAGQGYSIDLYTGNLWQENSAKELKYINMTLQSDGTIRNAVNQKVGTIATNGVITTWTPSVSATVPTGSRAPAKTTTSITPPKYDVIKDSVYRYLCEFDISGLVYARYNGSSTFTYTNGKVTTDYNLYNAMTGSGNQRALTNNVVSGNKLKEIDANSDSMKLLPYGGGKSYGAKLYKNIVINTLGEVTKKTPTTFSTIRGSPQCKIRLTELQLGDNNAGYTLFSVARYCNNKDFDSNSSPNNFNRIITSSDKHIVTENPLNNNYAAGFCAGVGLNKGKSGISYHNNRYVTDNAPTTEPSTVDLNWVLSVDLPNKHRSNGVDLSKYSNASDNILPPIGINTKSGNESYFELADVIIFKSKLSLFHIVNIEAKLAAQYGINKDARLNPTGPVVNGLKIYQINNLTIVSNNIVMPPSSIKGADGNNYTYIVIPSTYNGNSTDYLRISLYSTTAHKFTLHYATIGCGFQSTATPSTPAGSEKFGDTHRGTIGGTPGSPDKIESVLPQTPPKEYVFKWDTKAATSQFFAPGVGSPPGPTPANGYSNGSLKNTKIYKFQDGYNADTSLTTAPNTLTLVDVGNDGTSTTRTVSVGNISRTAGAGSVFTYDNTKTRFGYGGNSGALIIAFKENKSTNTENFQNIEALTAIQPGLAADPAGEYVSGVIDDSIYYDPTDDFDGPMNTDGYNTLNPQVFQDINPGLDYSIDQAALIAQRTLDQIDANNYATYVSNANAYNQAYVNGDEIDQYIRNNSLSDSLFTRLKASDYVPGNNTWYDIFNSNGVDYYAASIYTSTGLANPLPTVTNGTKTFQVIRGTIDTKIIITANAIPNPYPSISDSGYTLFHIARYTSSDPTRRGRIMDGTSDDWASGFKDGKAGVAWYNEWLNNSGDGEATPSPDSSINSTTNWVLSVSYSDSAAAYYRANGKSYYDTGNCIKYLPAFGINYRGQMDDSSDFEIAEIIIFQTRLTDTQIRYIEVKLAEKYGITLPTPEGFPVITAPGATAASSVDAIEGYINSNNLIPNLYARFKASEYTSGINWPSRGTSSNAIVSGTLNKSTNSGNGASNSFSTVTGTTSTKINYTTAIINNNGYTLFHVARYNGGTKGRIFDGAISNWLSGFWGGKPGVAFYNDWVGGTDYGPNPSPLSSQSNWVISVSYANSSNVYYRCNGRTFSNAVGSRYYNSLPILTTNNGSAGTNEPSDFEIADVIIFNTKLSDPQIVDIEGRLSNMYGISLSS